MDSTRTRSVEPIFMMAPLPQFFSIWAIARFSAFFLSSLTVDTAIFFHPVVRRFDLAGRRISVERSKGFTIPRAPEQSTKIHAIYQDFKQEILDSGGGLHASFRRQQKRILDVLDADVLRSKNDSDHIESEGVARPLKSGHPHFRRAAELSLFSPVHSPDRPAEGVRFPGLHLHQGDRASGFWLDPGRDQIDVAVAV